MKIVYPDYNNCIVNVSNSILKYFEVNTHHSTLKKLDNILNKKEYKNVVLILNDGLGANILERNLSKDSFLVKNKIDNITSVFPATTTAATTSITSGLMPKEHGWLGWYLYVPDIDKTITTYMNVLKDTNIPAADYNVARTYFPYKSVREQINEIGKYKAYGVSPYEDIPYNFEEPKDMYKNIKELCNKEGKKFIYAYYNDPDYLMHEIGVDKKEVKEKIEWINNQTEKMCDKLKDTLVIVTADHGLVNAEYIYLEDYPTLNNMLLRETSIESRATAFFIKEEYKKEFPLEFNKLFKKDFILLTKEEVIRKNLFGNGKENERFKDCIGDFMALAISNKCIADVKKDHPLIGVHAGITEDEVLVPLIVIEK